MNRFASLGFAMLAVTAGCRGERVPSPDAGPGASPSQSARAPSPECGGFEARMGRIPALLQEGKLDRAARVLRRAADGCPERAREVWSQLADLYAELGDAEALDGLAAQAKVAAPASSVDAIERAREKVAPFRAPAGDRAQARREARRLFAQATLEPKHDKARELFLQAARTLPPAGPALLQAGRAAARAGDKVEAQRLFDRALTALRRSTGQHPAIGMDRSRGAIRHLECDQAGRFVMAAADEATVVLDAIGWRPRFEFDQTPGDSSMSRDGTIVVFSDSKGLTSCSLLEATCVSAAVGDVTDVAVASDGERAAVVLKSGVVLIVDTAALQTLQSVTEPSAATTLAWAPSADRLWAGLKNGSIAGVNASTGAVEIRRPGHKGPVRALAAHARLLASADAKALRTGAPDGKDSEEIGAFDDSAQDPVAGLDISPDASTVFVERESALELWSVSEKKHVGDALQSMSGNVSAPRVAVTAARLYMGNNLMSTAPWIHRYQAIQPFRVADALALKDAEPLSEGASWGDSGTPVIQFLGAGPTLATVDDQCITTLWDVGKGSFLRTTRRFEAFRNCRGLVLTSEGTALLGSSDYRTVTRVDVASAAETPVPGEVDKALGVPGAPEESIDATSRAGVMLWVDKSQGVHVGRSPGPYRAVGKQFAPPDDRDVRRPAPRPVLSDTGDRGAFCKDPDTVVVFDVAKDESREVRKLHVSGFAFGADGTLFVSSLDGSVLMVRAEQQTMLFAPGGGILHGLAAAMEGRLIAGAVDHGPVYLWSAQNGALLATLMAAGDGGVAVAPDGSAELFNKAEAAIDCRFGPFVFGLELCRERLVSKGVLAQALSGKTVEP